MYHSDSLRTHLSLRGFEENTLRVKEDSCPGSKVVGRRMYPPCSSCTRSLTCPDLNALPSFSL